LREVDLLRRVQQRDLADLLEVVLDRVRGRPCGDDLLGGLVLVVRVRDDEAAGLLDLFVLLVLDRVLGLRRLVRVDLVRHEIDGRRRRDLVAVLLRGGLRIRRRRGRLRSGRLLRRGGRGRRRLLGGRGLLRGSRLLRSRRGLRGGGLLRRGLGGSRLGGSRLGGSRLGSSRLGGGRRLLRRRRGGLLRRGLRRGRTGGRGLLS